MTTTAHMLLAAGLAMAMAGSAPARAAAPAGSAELTLHGSGPYFSLPLPMSLYPLSASPDLRDLKVLNARGEQVPFAWLDTPPARRAEHQHAVRWFPVPGPASGAQPTPSRGWVLDARPVSGSLLKLSLSLPPAAHGVYTLAVEASDDLQHWRMLSPRAQVVWLQHQGQRLARTDIDLGGTRAGYLRLEAVPGSVVPELIAAQLTSVSQDAPPTPMQWSEPIAPSACDARQCDYAVPPQLPLERLELVLAEPNTLAAIDVLGRVDARPRAVPPHHPLRHELRELRHKHPDDSASPTWLTLASATVYWLRLPEGEVRSGPLWLAGRHVAQLRIRAQGSMAQLGAQAPRLRVGAHLRSLVFLARGPAPYRLAWGGDAASPPALPLAELMPARTGGERFATDTASLAAAPAAAPASAAAKPSAPPRSRTPWLWAALLAGVALMAVMAWSLLRGPRVKDPAAPPPPPSA